MESAAAEKQAAKPESAKEEHVTVGSVFKPFDLAGNEFPGDNSGLSPGVWTLVQSAPATFSPAAFVAVTDNLLPNPNITSSLLCRAEIFYDSLKDDTFNREADSPLAVGSFIKYMRVADRPRIVPGGFPGYKLERTVVRKLVPRNEALDKPLVQTCHIYVSIQKVSITDQKGAVSQVPQERRLILYVPHVTEVSEIPFYHPQVQELALIYTFTEGAVEPAPGILSCYFKLFPGTTIDNRASRTGLNMLRTIHKHAMGKMGGYEKRVYHDVMIAQKRFQDTYSRLRQKHMKTLVSNWVEQTEPIQHVQEDLGLAAFLIELWTDMYGGMKKTPAPGDTVAWTEEQEVADRVEREKLLAKAQENFPGFVDIGCGNGLLVHILMQEGWDGWGFDIRARKSWDMYPEEVRQNLEVRMLIPEIFWKHWLAEKRKKAGAQSQSPADGGKDQNVQAASKDQDIQDVNKTDGSEMGDAPMDLSSGMGDAPMDLGSEMGDAPMNLGSEMGDAPMDLSSEMGDDTPRNPSPEKEEPRVVGGIRVHSGMFRPGTFIIANHADELTIWTPLLAYFSDCPFLAMPCCSHNFSGQKFRAPEFFKLNIANRLRGPLRQELQIPEQPMQDVRFGTSANAVPVAARRKKQTDPKDKGKTKSTEPKQPSAYNTLWSYVMSMSEALGFITEKEHLRIQSTRNIAIVGRLPPLGERLIMDLSLDEREEVVEAVVAAEMKNHINKVAVEYVNKVEGLIVGKGKEH